MISLFITPTPSDRGSCATRLAIAIGLFIAGVIALGVIILPISSMTPGAMNAIGALECGSEDSAEQAESSGYAEDSIPKNYLEIYKKTGKEKGLPWNVLAGVGQVESKHGRWEGPGIKEGHNDWGAAGPMQFGAQEGSAAGNSWGGKPVMDADDRPEGGYGQDGNNDGKVSVYDPADAIPASADYLKAHGAEDDIRKAVFGYNHAWWYVDKVMNWAKKYSDGDFDTSSSTEKGVNCEIDEDGSNVGKAPNDKAKAAIDYAMDQRGKRYVWGGTGPDVFDCSGLMYKAYQSVGAQIPRVAREQWKFGPKVPKDEVQPGDLVFYDVPYRGSGGGEGPGHVGMVVDEEKELMVEARCTNCGPIKVNKYKGGDRAKIKGFTRPLENPKVKEQLNK